MIGGVGGGTFESDRVRGTVLPGDNDWINHVIGLGLGRPAPGGVVYEVLERREE